jgi:hypothetical protein
VPLEQPPTSALAELAALLRHLIDQRGTNNTRLERLTTYPRQQIGRAVAGHEVPSPGLAEALDAALGAGGRISALRERADREKKVRRLGLTPASHQPSEEEPTDRRDFLGMAALSLTAADILQRTPDGSDALTIADLQSDVDDVARRYDRTPHADLLPVAAAGWEQTKSLLGRQGLTNSDVQRLTLLSGQFTYYLGRITFAEGLYRASRRFAELSDRDASKTDDPLLPPSVAALRSSIAFYTGRYAEAAQYAGQARATAPPYLAARLAAYEARGWSAARKSHQAAEALASMRAAVIDAAAPLPGSSPFTAGSADMFTAVCSIRLHDGRAAEPYARAAVERLNVAGSSYEERGHALLALANCYLVRDRPDPESAVAAGITAVSLPTGHLTSTIAAAADRVWRRLETWHDDADIRHFGQLTATARQALPAGRSA